MNPRITKAEKRLDNGWLRTFVQTGGTEYLLPVSKPEFHVQGFNETPEAWPEDAVTEKEIWMDPRNEESEVLTFTGSTDPVLVAIAIAASNQDGAGPIAIPTPEQADATLAELRKKILQRKKE